MKPIPIIRSMLFVPGSQPERIDKAAASAADAVIVDLEDAVAPADKEKARAVIQAKRAAHPKRFFWVRINGLQTKWFADDLQSAADGGVDGIIVPKVESGTQVNRIADRLESMGGPFPEPPEAPLVVALIESALGVQNAFAIAAEGARFDCFLTLAFGAADFTADMGVDMSPAASELHYPRARIAVACRAAALRPPLDSPYMVAIKDIDGLIQDASRAKQLGYQGKLCIHPLQVAPVNEVFSPSEADIRFARKVIKAFRSAGEQGRNAVVVDGKFVDPPIVARARQICHWLEHSQVETNRS